VAFLAQDVRLVHSVAFDLQEEIETVLIPAARLADLLDGGQIRHALVQGALEAYWRYRSTLASVRSRLYEGAKPLDRSRGSVPRQRKHKPTAVESVTAAQAFELIDDGRRVEGRRVDVASEALRKLRRGHLPVDSHLDLHGMTAREAQENLEGFLRAARSRGERCVLIIHGKGLHSPLGVGVLRGEIAAWLSKGSLSRHVAAFATALDQQGGEGAVYVLIRR
jgi:DNA-nicking Smr family endonuclease